MVTTIELQDERADMEEIAKIYSNGNQSKYIRDLIWKEHKKNQEIQKIDNRMFFFQCIMFVLLGFTFMIFAVSTFIDFLMTISISLLFLSGFVLFFFVVINYKSRKTQKEVI